MFDLSYILLCWLCVCLLIGLYVYQDWLVEFIVQLPVLTPRIKQSELGNGSVFLFLIFDSPIVWFWYPISDSPVVYPHLPFIYSFFHLFDSSDFPIDFKKNCSQTNSQKNINADISQIGNLGENWSKHFIICTMALLKLVSIWKKYFW